MRSHAILIPVHSPKANYLVNLLYSLLYHEEEPETKIYLMCSNAQESLFFSNLISGMMRGNHLITILNCETLCLSMLKNSVTLEYFQNNTNTCVVNFKKFLGLYYLTKQELDYISVIDVDSIFVKPPKIFLTQARKNYLHKRFIGPQLSSPAIGVGPCVLSAALLKPEHQNVMSQDHNKHVYHWFLEPPTYHVPHLKEFFFYLTDTHQSLSVFFENVSWFTYDHLVYASWLVSTKDWRFCIYNHLIDPDSVPELVTADQLEKLVYEYNWSPAWLPARTWISDPTQCNLMFSNAAMIYHTDRT